MVNRYRFRKSLITDEKVRELLNRNEQSFQTAFNYFIHEEKSMVTLEECQALTRQCQLDVPDRMIGTVFAESLMTPIDTMRNKEKQMSMKYAEFVYFLCRMTDVHYSNTIYEQEPFYVKLDNLIAFLFDPFDLAP